MTILNNVTTTLNNDQTDIMPLSYSTDCTVKGRGKLQ